MTEKLFTGTLNNNQNKNKQLRSNMILSFIYIRMIPREGWKPRASPSVFNTSLGTLRMFMNDPSIDKTEW